MTMPGFSRFVGFGSKMWGASKNQVEMILESLMLGCSSRMRRKSLRTRSFSIIGLNLENQRDGNGLLSVHREHESQNIWLRVRGRWGNRQYQDTGGHLTGRKRLGRHITFDGRYPRFHAASYSLLHLGTDLRIAIGMQGNLRVRRSQGEHLRLPGQVRVRGPVVDPVSNEKLVIFAQDLGNEDCHLRRAELHARVSDCFCKEKHLLGKRV